MSVELAVLGVLVIMALMPVGPPALRPRVGVPGTLESSPWVRWSQPAGLGGRRRRDVSPAALPDLLEMTARSRRAGMALLPSLAAADAAVPEAGLARALARVEAGSALSGALDDWAAAVDHPDAELVVAVLLLGDASGAAVAARLDRSAATLRQRAALNDEVRALTAQSRASATVVAVAPLGFAVVVAATDDRVIAATLGTAVGRLSLLAGLTLDGLGIWWMRRLTRIEA